MAKLGQVDKRAMLSAGLECVLTENKLRCYINFSSVGW